MHVFALSMIADIGDKPSCLCHLNALMAKTSAFLKTAEGRCVES
jgi:hypothetical protein